MAYVSSRISPLFRDVFVSTMQRPHKRLRSIKNVGNFVSAASTVIRNQNYVTGASIQSLQVNQRRLRISFANNPHKEDSLQINTFWLRDHCRCSQCYNSTTDQRSADIISLKNRCTVVETKITKEPSQQIAIVWNDGHRSVYEFDWIRNNWKNPQRSPRTKAILWTGDDMKRRGLPTVSFAEFEKDKNSAMKSLIQNILTYGVGTVSNVQATFEETCRICETVALPHETVYGKFWKFSAENMEHADTAYTTSALGSHTDMTYYSQTSGLQVFHLLEHKGGEGGSTLLVDGFKVATDLRNEHPKAFQFLATTPIPCHYLDKNAHFLSEEPVIDVHPTTGQIRQFRFNVYDRAPLNTFETDEEVERFYAAYTTLGEIVRKPENEFWIQLSPGTIIFIDNFRVMHGRDKFTGKRVMCGCYLQRDSFLSNARVLGL